jgi:hypothetical protein
VYGIRVHNESDQPGEILVNDNTVKNAGKDGIQVIRGYRGTLSQYRSVKVNDNEVYDAGAVGVYVNTPRGVGQNNAVSVNGNTVVGAGSTVASIYLEDVVSGVVNGNVVSSWAVMTAGGIRIKDGKDIAINGNTITGPDGAGTAYGIYLTGTAVGATSDVAVEGNRVANTGTGVLRGIYLDDNTANCRVGDTNNWRGTAMDINNGAGTGHTIQFPVVSQSFTIPSLTAGASSRQLITLTGAKLGDVLELSVDADLQGMQLTGAVSGAGAARIQVNNITASTINVGTVNLRIRRRRVGN